MAEEMEMPGHGDFCWTEIASNDVEACKRFYANVFGWEIKKGGNTDGFDYTEFSTNPGEYPAGGMYQITKEMFGEHLPPPHYLSYISVDDVDAATNKAVELGGTIIKPVMEIPKVGKFSIVQDPTGAMFSLITLGGAQ